MKKEIIITADGSQSIAIPEMGVTYHSTHGAVQESNYVFIQSGLLYYIQNMTAPGTLSILEMGFGTGLNALLTLLAAEAQQQPVYYETIETHPLEASIYTLLNYCAALQKPGCAALFTQMHECPWNEVVEISHWFRFKKNNLTLADYTPADRFDIIYFDAFAPEIQPDLWTTEVFKKLHDGMQPGALLTTYCSKSIVRKAMAAAGLTVEKIPGPPHKREMVRALKAVAVNQS